MKKFLTVVLALMLVLSCVFAFASCAGGEEKETTADTSAATGAAQDTDASTDASDEKKVLKMGTNAYFKPYEYYEGEKIVGIDAEIAQAIADKLGMTLEIVDMEFDTIITAVNAGSVDFGMAGMTVTPDRLEEVDFTVSYAKGVQAVIVKEDSEITSADDLFAEGAAWKVGVQQGTTGDIYACDGLGQDRVTQYNNGNNAVLALLGGSVDCVIIDNEPAKALVAANEGLKILETPYADEDYAICIKKGNTELMEKINEAIVELIGDGTVDLIVSKYIK